MVFQFYCERNLDDVFFVGVGNVVEFYDVDSVGMNVFFVGIVKEFFINFFLIMEVSVKVKGLVRELKCVVDMNFFDFLKDFGFDLLIFKEKKEVEWCFEFVNEVVEVQNRFVEFELVYFCIWVERGKIWVNVYKGIEVVFIIVGDELNVIIDMVFECFEISLRYVFYFGRELERVYMVLKLRRSYVQEVKLF